MKVEVRNVSKRNRIVRLSFSLNSGDRIALIGPNGSGKSTLLQIIMGILPPDQGKVIRNQARLGAVFQNNILDETLSILQNLRFRARSNAELEAAKRLLDQFQIQNLKQLYGALSGGQKRIVNFVRTTMLRPNVLLLDELSAGMDIDIKNEAWQQVQHLMSDGPTVGMIYTTHDLGELIYANKVLFIQDGQEKYFGSVDQFVSQMPRYKLVVYGNPQNEERDIVQTTKLFDNSSEVVAYLAGHEQLKQRDFEVKHTSFDDLFKNIEATHNEN
ncbi:hypothetical protein YK48G_09080 [Lentilactobacillus fungorum]|uniref:ABC transporter domain-containing protein n=1 Tax=Lentilactobacillus fungorum TaxID=2201250 RepID=A0ABQ3VXQ7_9LACO|nr:ABC transporter ATP-binding protein [Lentilactobacillus fungorum]GHP13483.1 hypothetical protein YK48G_09080 [Lentilactobacillus fungorum]